MNKKNYTGAFCAKTDPGLVRISNEDQAKVLIDSFGEVLLLVCDGLGGQNKGDYASKLAIDSFSEAFDSRKRPFHTPFEAMRWLNRTCKYVNGIIYSEAEKSPVYKGMGTTLVAALLFRKKLLIANIGDSRAYRHDPANGLVCLTEDQTYVNYLVKIGQISKEESSSHPERHVLMNALGIYPSLSLSLQSFPYQGEAILLCSDGLYNNMSEEEIKAVLETDERVDQKVVSLISEANANGGSDNVGIAYWEAIHD